MLMIHALHYHLGTSRMLLNDLSLLHDTRLEVKSTHVAHLAFHVTHVPVILMLVS